MKQFLHILALWMPPTKVAQGQIAAPAAEPKRRSSSLLLQATLLLAALLVLGGQVSAQEQHFPFENGTIISSSGSFFQYAENGNRLGIEMSNVDLDRCGIDKQYDKKWQIHKKYKNGPIATTITITSPGNLFYLYSIELGGGYYDGTIDYSITTSKGGAPLTGSFLTAGGDASLYSLFSDPNFREIYSFSITLKSSSTLGLDAFIEAISLCNVKAIQPPSAPTSVTATADDGQATVSFTPSAYDGGLPITGYTVTSTPGNITAKGTTSPITVTGHANGTVYTFTVTASNIAKESAPSEASDAVTPVYKPDVLIVSNNNYDETQATAQLQKDLADRYDVIVSTTEVPALLDGYAQIYDVRVTDPITSSDATLYTDFLRKSPKNSLFLAGECLWFKSRNQSISSFIQQLGGGTIAPPVAESDSKKVALKVPFNAGASSISTVHLDGYGIVTESGKGSFIGTEANGTSGAGLYFPQGTLANAPTGSLVVMYDITFLASAAEYNYAFRMNLEQVMAAGGTLQGPSASTISLNGTPNPTAKHSPVTFTAAVTPGATGEVQFSEDGIVLENVTIDNGFANYSYPSIGLGERSIKAKYIGDASYNSSTSEVFKLNVFDVPDAPIIGTATAGDGQATVSFTPPTYDGGLPITGYTVTSSPGNITATGTSNPITVTGLANGTEYTFTVTTSNAVGTGAASAVSNSIKPMHTSVISWANPADITYGTTLGEAQLNATADVPGTFAYIPAAGSVLNAGNTQAITATFTPTDNGNTSVSKTLTINVTKAPLTVTASSHTIRKGEAIPLLDVSYDGFVSNDDEDVLDSKPTATTTVSDSSEEGTYDIVVSGGSDNNYYFIYVAGKLVVTTATGVDDVDADAILAYPNPFSNKLTIAIDGQSSGRYTLTSLHGALVEQGVVDGGKANLDLQYLKPGIYLLGVEVNGKSHILKVIKK